MSIAIVLFFLLTPLLVSYLVQRITLLDKIGTVLLCYAIGIIMGHTNFFSIETHALQDNIASGAILLALPILLLDANPRNWRKTAGSTFISMVVAVFILIFVVVAGKAIFGSQIDESWKVSGLLVGVYTGGTPNLASIKTALNVAPETYIAVHTIDTFLGALYLLFLMTFGKTWLRKFLPGSTPNGFEPVDMDEKKRKSIIEWFKTFPYKYGLAALGISLLIAAASAGAGFAVDESMQMTVIILTISALSIGFAATPWASRLKPAFPVGMYLINLFSLAVASRANFADIAQIGAPLAYYVTFTLFATFLLHILISRITKTDADTMAITSTALICSPPFVPVVAGALKNKNLLLPGITVGIIGYAVGNFLGVTIAYLLK